MTGIPYRVSQGLAEYTLVGYRIKMQTRTKKSVAARLRRIEGQVGGLIRMIEDDRYCVDILHQAAAVRAALQKAEAEILRDHVSHCVSDAFTSGNVAEQRHKVDELVETIGRMRR